MTAPRRRCACGKAALPGDAWCGECAVAIGERPDEDYLLEYAREQQHITLTSGAPYVYDKCPVCRHTWHGVHCDLGGCDCRTSCGAA